MSTRRRLRVADSLQEALAEILRRVKDPRVGMASVTSVELSPDMRHARVRISVIGDEETRRRTMEGLERARGFIRSELARAVRLRHVPELDFRLDQSAEYSVRIHQLLRSLENANGGAAGTPGGAAGPEEPGPDAGEAGDGAPGAAAGGDRPRGETGSDARD